MLMDVREYIDALKIDGHTIGEDHDDDPILIDPSGRAVDTWRENYPYDERMPREEYDETKYLLQVELLKFQRWVTDTGGQHVLLFEGRDAAGKGGTIKRYMEHLNPRYARTVALGKPSDREQASGTSSATSSTCPPRARWCSSTALGTTAPASNE
jgi:polyphosphate kinase